MIPVFCTTNLDDYEHEQWPRVFVGMPRVGEKVRSTNGGKILTIVSITHQLDAKQQPILWIELHRRSA